MLAKKKNSKRVSVAAVAANRKKSGAAASSYFASEPGRVLTPAHALAGPTSEDPSTALLRAIGDDVDTRLRALAPDEDLDADRAEEERLRLVEEARLAAGTHPRALAAALAAHLSKRGEAFLTGESVSKGGALLKREGPPCVRVRHNRDAITAVALLGLGPVVLGDKSGRVFLAGLGAEGGRGKELLEPRLAAGVVCLAVSDTRARRPTARDLFERTTVDGRCGSYTAAGAADGSISVWETAERRHRGLLFMHRAAVTGLSFRLETAELYSGSEDGTVRVWGVDGMNCVDVLFGHEGAVLGLSGLRRETCASVGADRTMRFWRIDAATQQAYQYHREGDTASAGVAVGLEGVAMLNDRLVVVGATDGSLVLFDVNRRRPLAAVAAAHGYDSLEDGTGIEKTAWVLREVGGTKAEEASEKNPRRRIPNPISAVAAVPYADLVASASYDGVVRLWSVLNAAETSSAPLTAATHAASQDNNPKTSHPTQLVCIGEIPVHALVTSMQFSMDADLLCIACSKESRRGRWFVQQSALNSVCVVPLTEKGEKSILCGMPHAIEHIPARLYHYNDDENEEEGNELGSEWKISNIDEAKRARPRRGGSPSSEMLENDDDDEEGASDGSARNEETDDFFTVGEDGQLVFNHHEEPADSPVDLKKKGGKSLKKGAGSKLLAKKGKPEVAKKMKIKKKKTEKGPPLKHPAKKLKKLRKTK